LCMNVSKKNTADTKYEYMYMYKYPTEEAPEGGEKAFIKSLSTYDTGYNLPVTVIGLDADSRFFDVHPEKSMNKAVINNSINERLGYKVGDKITFSDDASERSYTFIVTEICQYSPGFTIFMDRESMCELFDEEDSYYNAVYSDKALDIEEGRLYSVTAKDDIERASGVFIDQMQTLIWTLVIAGTVIFCVVMYLMMGVMIDRSTLGISLIKIFGYRSREIRSLYLNGNLVIVAVGGIICLPAAKAVIDMIYPSFIANVACCMDIALSPKLILMIYAAMLIIYLVINELLVFKVKRITPAEILRNRE
ncbi:MAG: ABC transporter permease, partial [Oscillospiraceae bacterium]|nr:ABC transporter permease [Oscillospiraceae bacterium]